MKDTLLLRPILYLCEGLNPYPMRNQSSKCATSQAYEQLYDILQKGPTVKFYMITWGLPLTFSSYPWYTSSMKNPFMSAEEFWRTSPKFYPARTQEEAWEFAEAYAEAIGVGEPARVCQQCGCTENDAEAHGNPDGSYAWGMLGGQMRQWVPHPFKPKDPSD